MLARNAWSSRHAPASFCFMRIGNPQPCADTGRPRGPLLTSPFRIVLPHGLPVADLDGLPISPMAAFGTSAPGGTENCTATASELTPDSGITSRGIVPLETKKTTVVPSCKARPSPDRLRFRQSRLGRPASSGVAGCSGAVCQMAAVGSSIGSGPLVSIADTCVVSTAGHASRRVIATSNRDCASLRHLRPGCTLEISA